MWQSVRQHMVGGVGCAKDRTTREGLPVRETHRDDPLDYQVRGILELHHIIGIPGSLALVYDHDCGDREQPHAHRKGLGSGKLAI